MINRFEKIKLLVTDVDGVMTDGGMYYFDNDTEGKKFNTRDGLGIQLLRKKGIKVGILTQENNPLIAKRAKKLEVEFCRMGIMDKAEVLDNMRGLYELTWEQVAYVGDDINDIGALELAGIAMCPIDAMPEVQAICDPIIYVKGGSGVIREIYERHFKWQ